MGAGNFRIHKLFSEACMRDLSKLATPLEGFIERTWYLDDFVLAFA